MQTGMSGNFLSCLKGVKDPFEAQEGRWDFSRDTAAEKDLITRLGENLLVFLELRQQTWGSFQVTMGTSRPAHGDSGKSSLHVICDGSVRIPLQLLPLTRSSSGVESRNSGFLSSADMNLGVSPTFPQGSQASSRVETCKSALLSSWKSSVRFPVG